MEQTGLRLRPLEREDAALLARWLGNETVLEFYEGRDNPFDEEKVLQKFYQDDGALRWILMYQESSVGYLQTYPVSGEECREEYHYHGPQTNVWAMDLFIGAPSLWGYGLGKGFVTLALNMLVQERGADCILLDPQARNVRAIRCYEACGFARMLRVPEHELHEGVWQDCWIMAHLPSASRETPTAFDALLRAAKAVAQPRVLSPYAEAGGVGAALQSVSGAIYTGVCIDTACSMGFCAEHAAAAAMVTAGENELLRMVAVNSGGKPVPPCGRCREFLTQLHENNHAMQVLLGGGRVVKMSDLLPEDWKDTVQAN